MAFSARAVPPLGRELAGSRWWRIGLRGLIQAPRDLLSSDPANSITPVGIGAEKPFLLPSLNTL